MSDPNNSPEPVKPVNYNPDNGPIVYEKGDKDNSVFCTYEADIQKMWKTEEEREHIRQLVKEAEMESEAKKMEITRKTSPWKKTFTRWKVLVKYGIHWKKPFYPFRLAKNILLAQTYKLLGLRKYVFRGMEFAITYRCNFSCTHCLCANIDETTERLELQPEEYHDLVAQAMDMGATTFGLEGGEPLFNKNWQEIIKAFKPKYNHVIISTNGYLLDEQKTKECAEQGVDTINISLDSGIPELHDLFRRKRGSYDKVIQVMDWSDKYGIKIVINTTLHKGNLYTRGFRELLEFSERRKYMVNILFAKGVGEFKSKDSMLDDQDIANYREIIKPYAYAHIHHTAGREGHDDSANYNYGAGGCPGSSEMFNLTPYGDVIQCANMHIYFGNVRKNSLRQIREKVIKESAFAEPRDCFLTLDKDFMNVYYPLIDSMDDDHAYVSLDEFNEHLAAYEKEKGRLVYPTTPHHQPGYKKIELEKADDWTEKYRKKQEEIRKAAEARAAQE